MLKRMIALGFLLLAAADLAGCANVGVTPCDATARQSVGPCAVGHSHESPG